MKYVNTKIIINTENAGYSIRLASQLRQMGLYSIVKEGRLRNSEEPDIASGCTILISDKQIDFTDAGTQKIILTSGNVQRDCISYSDDILYVSKSIGISGICDLVKFISDKDSREKKAERAAAELIRRMGIQVNLKGYRYLITAIVMTALNSEPDFMGAAEIYENIADIYKVQVNSVERAIRHSIELAHERCPEALSGSFSYPVTKPNNTELILYAADTIRLWIL